RREAAIEVAQGTAYGRQRVFPALRRAEEQATELRRVGGKVHVRRIGPRKIEKAYILRHANHLKRAPITPEFQVQLQSFSDGVFSGPGMARRRFTDNRNGKLHLGFLRTEGQIGRASCRE